MDYLVQLFVIHDNVLTGAAVVIVIKQSVKASCPMGLLLYNLHKLHHQYE